MVRNPEQQLAKPTNKTEQQQQQQQKQSDDNQVNMGMLRFYTGRQTLAQSSLPY